MWFRLLVLASCSLVWGCEKQLETKGRTSAAAPADRPLNSGGVDTKPSEDQTQNQQNSSGNAVIQTSKLPWDGSESLKTAQWEAVSID